MAQITIDPARVIGSVQPRLYGGFVEHRGRCVYGGIWEEGSPLSDEQGYRRDVRDAVRELGVTTLCYPGGNFVSNYYLRDGVGPRASRPARRELAWRTVESNYFGADEFLAYCGRLGCEPYLCVNLGTGTPEEAADWLGYCNSTQPTAIARQRAANGHPRPYDVRLWGLGNEMYGRWQVGQRPAHDYALVARETAKAMRLVDPRIELVAVGHENGPWWNATALAETVPYIDHLALHVYVGSDDTAEAPAQPPLLERLARQHAALIDLVLTDLGLDTRIDLAFDEWNVWYRAVPERVRAKHNLDEIDDPDEIRRLTGLLATEEPYNLRDRLSGAYHLLSLATLITQRATATRSQRQRTAPTRHRRQGHRAPHPARRPRLAREQRPAGAARLMDMAMPYKHDTTGDDTVSAYVSLTTDHVTTDAAGPLADALHAAGVAVERHAFLPVRGEEQHPWSALLLAASGPPLPLARLVVPASTPAGVASALAAALAGGGGERPALATLQLKADGVFVSIRGRDLRDITMALDALPAQLTRLDTRRGERRLVYAESAWRIDP